jgi:hypothetical protein
MITRNVQRNNFGGHSWMFKLDSLHHVYLNQTCYLQVNELGKTVDF